MRERWSPASPSTKFSRSMPIGIRSTPSGGDTGREHELLHLSVRHLDPREAVRPCPERLEARVELGDAGRARPSVQVRGRESMRRPEPVRAERFEMAREEDGLALREACPPRRADLEAEPSSGGEQVLCVFLDRPSPAIADREEPRMVGPAGGPGADERPGDRLGRRSGCPPRGCACAHPESTWR